MDWNNVDLKSGYERSQNILDGYDFDTLLLEIACNVREINKESVKAQVMESLANNIRSAKEVFEANLDNITEQAIKEREK